MIDEFEVTILTRHMVHRTEAQAEFPNLLGVLLLLTAKPRTNDSHPVLLGENTRVEYVKRWSLTITDIVSLLNFQILIFLCPTCS